MYNNKTRHQICFMIFYSINPSIFLQSDKYSNTGHIWQHTAEYLIDILHFDKKNCCPPSTNTSIPAFCRSYLKINTHGELLGLLLLND